MSNILKIGGFITVFVTTFFLFWFVIVYHRELFDITLFTISSVFFVVFGMYMVTSMNKL